MLTCLVDVDGTLIDSRQPILSSLNDALAEHGQAPIKGTDLWRHVGPPLCESLTDLLSERDGDLALVEPLIAAFRRHYSAASVDMARSYEGIPELLARLLGKVRMGVVTSKPIQFARPILEALGFAELMEAIEGPSIDGMEPKTETLARALRLLNHAPDTEGFVMIGDRHHDIEAARVNGISSIGVTWGFGTLQELGEAGADQIVESPVELGGLLGV